MRRTLISLAVMLTLCAGCSSLIAQRILRPPKYPERVELLKKLRAEMQQRWNDDFHAISYKSSNGTQLSAIYLTPPDLAPRGVVVFLHGFGDQKEGMLPLAELWALSGYVAVTTDLRAHGESSGKYTTFGWRERWELRALLDEMQKRGHDVSRVGVIGRSLGAATALQWAGVDERIGAVVAMSPFGDLRTEAEFLFSSSLTPLSRQRMASIQRAVEKEGCFKIDAVSPLEAVRDHAVPVYLIHGSGDQVVPATESQRIFEVAAGPVVMQIVPNAGHHDLLSVANEMLVQRMLEWTDTYVAKYPRPVRPPLWFWTLPHRHLPAQEVVVANGAHPGKRVSNP